MISSLSESTNIPNLISHKILIVGDVAADRQLYCQYLRADLNWRYTILETDSLTTALVMCQNHQIDGILLDNTFPDRTGWEFLQALPQQFGDNYPPIVMVTDESNLAVPVEVAVQRAVRAMKLGVSDYLLKQTLTPECLQLAMQSAIDRPRFWKRKTRSLHYNQNQNHSTIRDFPTQAEHEQLLQQLETERSLLEQILQQMPSGVAIAEIPSGKLLFHNEEAIRLLRHTMKNSGTYKDYVQYGALHADGTPYQPEEYPIARAVRAGEIVKAEEMRYLRGDGTETIFSVNAAPIVDRSGNKIVAVSTFEDISERKQIEIERTQLLAEAEAANRSKDEFVALVAHELRSPLNAIMGWAKLLQTRQFDAATTKKALETIVRNTQSQVQLVEDLLDISRMVRGTLHLTTTPVNLVNVIETALETVRPTAEAKEIQLEAQIQNITPVLGDFHRLQQLVLNLLTNSIKFTPEGGQVQVLLEQHHSQARIEVRDTGKGISSDFLPYIFERFCQDQQNTTAKQGLGLGLAIVKHIADMHNGKVTVESQGEGQGATFTVMLPLLESNEVEEQPINENGEIENTVSTSVLPHVSTTNSQSPLTKLRVLLVDDEPDMLNLTAFILKQYGAIAHTATNVNSALEELREFQPQILISDIAMPEQDGYVLLQQMRNIYPEGQIPAIALTAYASNSRQEQSLRAGFRIHLTKPVEPEALVKAILSTIERREP